MTRRHLILYVISVVVVSILADMALLNFDSIRNAASVESSEINTIFRVLLLIAVPVFVLVTTGMMYALWFFRQKHGERGDGSATANLPTLEIAWTIIPLLIVVGVSIYGTAVLGKLTTSTQQDMQINVTAQRYSFKFEYPEYGITSYTLELPVDQPVHFTLTSLDVVHSFWVPEFGPKEDCVPGIFTELRLTPTQAGNFTVYCSQLCGPGHTYMTAPVVVGSQGEFDNWVKSQQTPASTTATATH